MKKDEHFKKQVDKRIEQWPNRGKEGPFSLHVLGIGKAGAGVIRTLLGNPMLANYLKDTGSKFTALTVDIGTQDLQGIEAEANKLPSDRVQVRARALEVPDRDDLFATLYRYREFLKKEHPRYYWNPNYDPWIPPDYPFPAPGESFSRGLAKAIYGKAYYADGILDKDLTEFAESVRNSEGVPLVFVVFGLSGGTGSGMVVDLARHLSFSKLSRLVPVTGISVYPCAGDPPEKRGAVLFPIINEYDIFVDSTKNPGVQAIWGDFYDVPFTGGTLMVSQETAWEATHDIEKTNSLTDEVIANFISRDSGAHAANTLKLLGWLNDPGQDWPPLSHRQMAGPNWVNMFTAFKPTGKMDQLKIPPLNGIKQGFKTEYMEAYVHGPKSSWSEKVEEKIKKEFSKYANNITVFHGESETEYVEILLPQLSKVDLGLYRESKPKYEEVDETEKLLMHSYTVELGVMVSEPSIRFENQAGECIWGCACWVAIPYELVGGAV